MSKDIPISQVRPTHSSSRMVKFTNIDAEDFIHGLSGKNYKFKKGVTVLLPESFAYHFARNLAHKIIFRDDGSLEKYAGVNERLNRERTNRGENPIVKSIGKEAVESLIKEILNNHVIQKVEEESDVLDASELGMVVPERKKEEKKESKKGSKAKKEEVKEEEMEEDFDLDI